MTNLSWKLNDKVLILVAIITLVVVGLTGCGGGGDEDQTDRTTQPVNCASGGCK